MVNDSIKSLKINEELFWLLSWFDFLLVLM